MYVGWFARLCVAVCFVGVGGQRSWGSSGGYNPGFSNAWNSGLFGGNAGSSGNQQSFQNSFGQPSGGSSGGSSSNGFYSPGNDKDSNWGASNGNSWQSDAFNVRPTEGKSSTFVNNESSKWKERPSDASQNQNSWNSINSNNYNENEVFSNVDDYDDNSISSWNSNNNKKSQSGSSSFGGSGKWETTTEKKSNNKWKTKPSNPSGGNSWSSNAASNPPGKNKTPIAPNKETTMKPSTVDASVLDELDQNDWYFGKESDYPKPPFKSTLNIDVSELWNFDKNRKKTNQGFGGSSNTNTNNNKKNDNNSNNNKYNNNNNNKSNNKNNKNSNSNNYRNDDNSNSNNNNNNKYNNYNYRNDGAYSSNSNNIKSNSNSNNYRDDDDTNSNKYNNNNYRNDGAYNSNTNNNKNNNNSNKNKNSYNTQYNSNKNNGNNRRRNRQTPRSRVASDDIKCECVSVNNCDEEDRIITREDLGFDSRPLEEFRCSESTEVCCTNPKVESRGNVNEEEEELGCGQRKITGSSFGKFSVNLAEPGEFPWMLTLENTDNCSATLIHHRLALTAAHCTISAVPNELVLRAGLWNSNDEPSQTRTVARIIPHPDYSSQQPRNDIALLVVEEPFVLTANVNPVCLPVTNDKWDSSRCVVAGWRGEEIGGRAVEAVEKGVVNFLPQVECQNMMLVTDLWRNYVLHDSFVCGWEKSGRQSCTGDEGGFVVCPSRKQPDTYLQIGVVSKGMNCDNFGRPGIFTNVLKFLDWINQNYFELGLFDDIDIRSLTKKMSK